MILLVKGLSHQQSTNIYTVVLSVTYTTAVCKTTTTVIILLHIHVYYIYIERIKKSRDLGVIVPVLPPSYRHTHARTGVCELNCNIVIFSRREIFFLIIYSVHVSMCRDVQDVVPRRFTIVENYWEKIVFT